MEIIGLFGGTFNPIHHGHLALAQTVLETLQCSQVRFIPSALPPHKTAPAVTAQHRAAMVQLAIRQYPQFILDTCELDRQGPSYTIETLHLLKHRLPDQSLCLIMGQDSYQQLPTWHRWLELLDYCHLLIVHRADYQQTLTPHPEHAGKLVPESEAAKQFSGRSHGLISYLGQTPPDISSTHIRETIRVTGTADSTDLPDGILHYIQENHLYQT
jgi:nicotinate-nucleotide adenylyltransferase